MTDNEIIKALEICSKGIMFSKHDCKKCPYYAELCCERKLKEDALDIINRQKAEIERLKGWQDLLKAEKHSLIKAEAIKEFAERLKNKLTSCSKTIDGKCEYHICDSDIDNLVKEMVGDV